MGALSRAVALRFGPEAGVLTAGSNIDLGINPSSSASSRTLSAETVTTTSQAVARGLGAGDSRAYSADALAASINLDHQIRSGFDTDSTSFYQSTGLTIESGGGSINGAAVANSLASSGGSTLSTAGASNIGLANVSYLDRYGGKLAIGSDSLAFSASALAASDNTIELEARSPISTPAAVLAPPVSSLLDASAVVRGVETTEGQISTFYGQPTANVAATAAIDQLAEFVPLDGEVSSEAIGLERVLAKAVPAGNGDGTATLGGKAVANSTVTVGSGWGRYPGASAGTASITDLDISARAVGVTESQLYGAPTLNTTVEGEGLAIISLVGRNGHGLDPSDVSNLTLEGIGIKDSGVFTNNGNDLVTAAGGIVDAGITFGNRLKPLNTTNLLAGAPFDGTIDTAGFSNSQVYTGLGNDKVMGVILSEYDTQLDVNGDGQFSKSVYLDRGALDKFILNGYDGFRNTTVDTGAGADQIVGSSNGSFLYGSEGNDSISLDRSKDSSLWGGLGNDSIAVDGPVRGGVSLYGGLGNDKINAGSEADGVVNVQSLDGGFGQDVMTGGAGVDRYLFGNAGAALDATSSTAVNTALTDTGFWSRLSDGEKDLLWREGVLLGAQPLSVQKSILAAADPSGHLTAAGTPAVTNVDTINNFEAGAWRDVLEINASLGGMDQEIWQCDGSLFSVDNKGDLNVIETSSPHPNRIGVVLGALADIQKMGIGSPQIAYATDTHQLMYDGDGDWSGGSISLGTVNVNGALSKANFRFGSDSGDSLGYPNTAPCPT